MEKIQQEESIKTISEKSTTDNNTPSLLSDTLKTLRVIPSFPSVLERYYKSNLINDDLMILTHSNRISLVTLAPTHEVLKLKKSIQSIDFNTSKKINRLDNSVQGKGKKGAQKVKEESMLCSINCKDGSKYKIAAGIKGKIIEINKSLVDQPSLITEKPFTDGYIAIILPPFSNNNNK